MKTHIIHSDVSAENCEASIRDYGYKLYRHCSHLSRMPQAVAVGRGAELASGSAATGADQPAPGSEIAEIDPLGDLAGRVAHARKMKDPG